jgi:hypothetical protein
MSAAKMLWIGIACAMVGCTQVLELDLAYRSSGTGGTGGSIGVAGDGGTGGECDEPADCTWLPQDDECRTRTCDNHACGQSFAVMGTPLKMQVVGDCVEAVCDGAGSTMTQPNDKDVPVDDNPCTKNVCTGGVPSFPLEPSDTPCGNGGVCDGAGVCKRSNGQACVLAVECTSGFCIDGVCCDSGCLATCRSCNVAGLVGSCVNVPLGEEDPVATTACNGVRACNGKGTCLLDNGQNCNNNAQCVSNKCLGIPKTCQP